LDQVTRSLPAPPVAGPIIWFLAVAITPFGVPPLRRALTSSTHDTAHVDHLSAESAGHK